LQWAALGTGAELLLQADRELRRASALVAIASALPN
jgi:hypothetical protein